MNEFDQKAQDWDKNRMHLERTMAVAGLLRKFIPAKPDLKALEFGAGTGLLSFFLKDMFSEITLMDSSREMLKMAEQKMDESDRSKFRPLYFNLEKDETSGESFDILYSQMVLHHVRNTDAIFGKFYHLLNPEGILAIADLYEEDGSFHDGDMDVHKGFDPEKLTSVLLETGFHEIQYQPCFIIRKEISAEKIKEFPVFLLTAIR